jgi:hypothetical protein
MENQPLHLHVIAFNVPFPADYGGVIDVFHKIRSLHEAGIRITLHCFEYGRVKAPELESICDEVYYYHRPKSFWYQLHYKPYIVVTRSNTELLKNLLSDNDPILFDGLHTTYFFHHPKLQNRIKIVRAHNIEYQYYSLLAKKSNNLISKCFHYVESVKLFFYEKTIKAASGIAAISASDAEYFSKINPNTQWIGAFHANDSIKSLAGKGKYLLYHANLEVAENLEAMDFILKKVMPGLNLPLVIAGKNPPPKILSHIIRLQNVKLIANPSDEDMRDLLFHAHIHLLPTFQPTGLKLKLISSLHIGRHIVVTPEMIEGSGLEALCHVVKNEQEMQQKINELWDIPFDDNELEKRKTIMDKNFSNKTNTEKLIRLIWDK